MANKYLEKIAVINLVTGYAGAKKGDKVGGTLIGGPIGGAIGAGVAGAAAGAARLVPSHALAAIVGGTLVGGYYGGKAYSHIKAKMTKSEKSK